MEKVVNNQKGFTLIEIIVVIVILGIIAVTAIPRYIDMQVEAETAALDGVAGALNSAAAINFAGSLLNKGTPVTAGTNCSDIANLLEGGLPNGYNIQAGTAPNCVVETTGGAYTTTFTALTTS